MRNVAATTNVKQPSAPTSSSTPAAAPTGTLSSSTAPSTSKQRDEDPKAVAPSSKSKLTPEQIEYYKEAYTIFDHDSNGVIDMTELSEVMQSLGINPTEEELYNMIKDVDLDNTGTIDFDEFLLIMEPMVSTQLEKQTAEQLKESFEAMDADGDGWITVEDLMVVFKGIGEGVPAEEALRMVGEADMDGDGKVGFEDFKKGHKEAVLKSTIIQQQTNKMDDLDISNILTQSLAL
ncbi:hypothetical protein HDV05_005696, partial [Chytridiales sp. JEL 0842]